MCVRHAPGRGRTALAVSELKTEARHRLAPSSAAVVRRRAGAGAGSSRRPARPHAAGRSVRGAADVDNDLCEFSKSPTCTYRDTRALQSEAPSQKETHNHTRVCARALTNQRAQERERRNGRPSPAGTACPVPTQQQAPRAVGSAAAGRHRRPPARQRKPDAGST